MSRFSSILSDISINLKGHCISQKIIIFESDDWGSIRMPGNREYNFLYKAGIPVDKSKYCKYDKIESDDDVSKLLDVLSSVKSNNGESPILTANFVTANPDFDKIRKNSFNDYHYESIEKTYSKLKGHEKVLKLILEGKNEGIIIPQFHGRDHVNSPLWIDLLKRNIHFKIAFDLGLWGLSKDVFPDMEKSIQATYDTCDLEYCKESIKSGLTLFEKIFKYKSETFIANNFVWDNKLDETLFFHGVKHFQSMKYQFMPIYENKRIQIRRVFGQKNSLGMTYGVRNCSFEPTVLNDTVESTLSQIKNAFKFKKPAIISTHRINFSGGMDIKNRDDNLVKLKSLLKIIVKKWPDVQFLSSQDLIQILRKK